MSVEFAQTAFEGEKTDYTFLEVHVMGAKGPENERFFIGRLPKVGESVEMIYVGDTENGAMRLQLRVKE